MTLTDDHPMPFGKHKGTAMANVPADYLIWLYDNGKCNTDVNDYVVDNMDVLRKEINDKNKK